MSVDENICDYMNSRYDRHYKKLEISIIRNCIDIERKDRKLNNIQIASRTKKGKELINKRIAEFANQKLQKNKLTAQDVRRFELCRIAEYENRTGKCSWGIPSVIEKLGFDP